MLFLHRTPPLYNACSDKSPIITQILSVLLTLGMRISAKTVLLEYQRLCQAFCVIDASHTLDRFIALKLSVQRLDALICFRLFSIAGIRRVRRDNVADVYIQTSFPCTLHLPLLDRFADGKPDHLC